MTPLPHRLPPHRRLRSRIPHDRPCARSDAPTIVMLHEGLGSRRAVGRFSGKAAGRHRRRRVRLFARRLWRVDAGKTAAAARLHAHRGARRAAESCSTRSAFAAGCWSAIPTAPRSRRSMPARIRIIACRARADRAAFHRRGYFGGLDRRDQDGLRDHAISRQSWRAGTRTSTTPSTAGTAPGSIRNSATGIFRNISPISASPSRSCRVWMTNMGRCVRSRSRRKSAIVRSM